MRIALESRSYKNNIVVSLQPLQHYSPPCCNCPNMHAYSWKSMDEKNPMHLSRNEKTYISNRFVKIFENYAPLCVCSELCDFASASNSGSSVRKIIFKSRHFLLSLQYFLNNQKMFQFYSLSEFIYFQVLSVR